MTGFALSENFTFYCVAKISFARFILNNASRSHLSLQNPKIYFETQCILYVNADYICTINVFVIASELNQSFISSKYHGDDSPLVKVSKVPDKVEEKMLYYQIFFE